MTPATLRNWEGAGIVAPARDPATGYCLYQASDIRDAEFAHLLRRGGYLLDRRFLIFAALSDCDQP